MFIYWIILYILIIENTIYILILSTVNTSVSYSKMGKGNINVLERHMNGCIRRDGLPCKLCCYYKCCEDVDLFPPQTIEFNNSEQMWIPIWFTVMLTPNETNWAPKEKILIHIAFINTELERLNVPFRFLFQYYLVLRNKEYADTCNIKYCKSDDCLLYDPIIGKFTVSPSTHLTVYICKQDTWDGLSTLPWGSYETKQDQFIILSQKVFKGDISDKESLHALSKIFLHKIGHYMGLLHPYTVNGTCKGNGDYVEDTPQSLMPGKETFSCDTKIKSCPLSKGFDQLDNYMDYYSLRCQHTFTVGQVARMKKSVLVFRPLLKEHTSIKLATAMCIKGATHFDNCSCGLNSLCSPERFCRASNNPVCNGPDALTTYLCHCSCNGTVRNCTSIVTFHLSSSLCIIIVSLIFIMLIIVYFIIRNVDMKAIYSLPGVSTAKKNLIDQHYTAPFNFTLYNVKK